MIQDIYPHHINNQYIANKTIEENDYVLCFKGNSMLLKTQGEKLSLPQKKDFSEISGQTEYTFLFTFNGIPCFLIRNDLNTNCPNFVFREISFFRSTSQQEIAWASMLGLHLANWYSQNRFCGICGTKTQHKSDERALICPECNSVVYPKISPAIIVALISNDKILLARGSNFTGNWHSLIAGYVDVGESLEETVIREVKEEVGLDVKNIRYYKSQPWPLSGSMMVGFVADADESQPITIDTKEIAEAAWFSRGNLPEHSRNLSIAGEMIEKFENGEI